MWMPNGYMKDGTLIFGPSKELPKVTGSIHELNVDGKIVYVALCCNKEKLTDLDKLELIEFCRGRINF
jgi:hypothetical protein